MSNNIRSTYNCHTLLEMSGQVHQTLYRAKLIFSRDTYLDWDSFTLFYTANCNVTVAVTYLELDNVTSKMDTNFLCTSSKSVN